MGKTKKVAIFDIDGTIFRSSLLIELVEILIENGVFDESVRADYKRQQIKWLDRKGDYETYVEAVVKVFIKNIKGVHYSDFDRATKIVVGRYQNRTYQFTRDLIKKLKAKGYFLLAISYSPKRTLDVFCKQFGFDKIYGIFYELGPSDRFTGKIADEHLIMNKATIVKRVIDKENLTLKGSCGVGDTDSDINFLELVENPICFNPNKNLYRHAKRNGWKVVVERKDMVHEIK
jgi:HAD superfamily hydrolase (TIGR01490 family)